ncbi:MAG: Lin0512 family protein [Proteobacteria bacterium]|nr:Lin0512 family protein [Pseudomonadota bacterium]MDA0884246.1 Lin0512 family protein [Pseudomonadota bacterium]MDA1150831.1 Lin0512 family protein [Pseudomonadota bacterium]
MKRIILEMGTGNDLYGEDYTKAACRAVDDALHHSSLTLFRSLGFDHADMDVRVTIAVQDPEKVDQAIVATTLPRGNAIVQVVKGGLDVVDNVNNTKSVIATAAVEAYLDINPTDWVSA